MDSRQKLKQLMEMIIQQLPNNTTIQVFGMPLKIEKGYASGFVLNYIDNLSVYQADKMVYEVAQTVKKW